MKGFLEVGIFEPTSYEYVPLAKQWREFLSGNGFYVDSAQPALTVRLPTERYSAYGEGLKIAAKERIPTDFRTRMWHKDQFNSKTRGAGTILMWSNIKPTIYRPNRNTKEVIDTEPFMVVAFDNRKFEHRQPDMTLEEAKHRYFCRCIFPRYFKKDLV